MEIVHLEEKEIEKKEQMLIDMTKSEKMCVKQFDEKSKDTK